MRLLPLLLALPCATPAPPAAPGWELVWSDEFESAGLPDATKWGYDVGYVANQELQYYTEARRENARVEDGVLVIEAREEALFDGFDYTSARLNTRGRAAWRYGRVEVRARLPRGRGMWPAIWMLGTAIGDVGWPACGEIDIMENVGFEPDVIHANVHTEAYNGSAGTNRGNRIAIEAPHADFHVYAIEWFEDRIDFFADGEKYFSYADEGTGPAAWPFDREHFLILNLAVGGIWGGQRGVDDSAFPQRLLVDYVRVYRRDR